MKISAILLILATGTFAVASEEIFTESTWQQEFRNFTGEGGKTVRGKILIYNPDSNYVSIAKEDRKTFQLDLSQCSDADQAYVREWHHIHEFFTQSRFHLSAKKKRAAAGQDSSPLTNEDSLRVWKSTERIIYEIRLGNRGSYNLEGLTLDYCIYYGEEKLNYRGQLMSRGVKCGTRNIETLARGKTVQFETESVVFPKVKRSPEYYKDNNVPLEKGMGIWVRVYLPLADGSKAMRELSLPDALIKQQKGITPK